MLKRKRTLCCHLTWRQSVLLFFYGVEYLLLHVLALFVNGKAVVVSEGIVFNVGVIGDAGYDEVFGETLCFAVFGVALVHKIPEDTEDQGAEEVDEEVLHGIGNADIEIAPFDDMNGAVTGDNVGFDNVFDANTGLDIVRVKGDRADACEDDVLLHIHRKEVVHRKFPKLPEHADGHRKAEGDHGEVEGGEVHVLAVAV